PDWTARRAELLLLAGGQARGIRPATASRAADTEPPQERGSLGGERGRHGCAGARRPAQTADGRTRGRERAGGHESCLLIRSSPTGPLGGLNSFYLLVDKPEVYGLPRHPELPTQNLRKSAGLSVASAAVMGVLALVGLRKRRMDEHAGASGPGGTSHAS